MERETRLRTSHRRSLDHQEGVDLDAHQEESDLPPERSGERGRARPAAERAGPPPRDAGEAGGSSKADAMEAERDVERREGISEERRGSRAAPSDRTEREPPHPQDVNEIGEAG